MRKFLVLLLLPFVFSCEIQYEGDKRFIVKSVVVDNNGMPLQDLPIEIKVQSGNLTDMISFNQTDGGGKSLQMFPPPEDNDATFTIEINSDGGIYQSKTYYNIRKSDFQDYLLDLGEMVLLKNESITTFSVTLERVNENTQMTDLYIDATTASEIIDYETAELQYLETHFRILKNQNFTLFYEVTDYSTPTAVVTQYSIPLSVAEEPVSYQINY